MAHHENSAVPLSDRRSALTLGLIWITMVTFFPTVIAGFQWFKEGITISQVLIGTICSCFILIAYTSPVSFLSAKTGLGYAEMNKRIFGPLTCVFLNFNILWIFTAWYGVSALFLAEGLQGLFHWHQSLTLLASGLAVAMAFNNFFGFKGIANFARYFAAPVLICWVLYCFLKTLPACPPTVLQEGGRLDPTQALTIISSFVIGIAVWGNEADYWRYGKPKWSLAVIPLGLSLLIGQILFPITGWMLARMTNITEYGAATEFVNSYSFGGLAVVGAVVLIASQFAANDSNLFGSSLAMKAIRPMSHKQSVALLAFAGTITAAWLACLGAAKALESIAALNCVFLPAPSVIVVTEVFLVRRWLCKQNGFAIADSDNAAKKAALVALLCAILVGVATSGAVPALSSWRVGICPLQCWLTALFVYLPVRALQLRRSSVPSNAEMVPVPILTHSAGKK